MSEDHCFIDSSGSISKGKEVMTKGWGDFFKQFPDYQNHFLKIEYKDGLVIIQGESACSYEALDGPTPWTAKLRDGLITEWRISEDSEVNRKP